MKSSECFNRLCTAETPEALLAIADDFTEVDDLKPLHGPPAALAGIDKLLVVFGAGRFARSVLTAWLNAGISPDYCVDNNPTLHGTTLLGVPVFHPSVLLNRSNPAIVVVATMQTHSIQRWLDAHQIPHLFAEMDGSINALPGHRLLQRRHELIEVWQSFADARSRKIFLAAIKARVFQQFWFDMIGSPFLHHVASGAQYFVPELPTGDPNRAFVDCGAFDGDFVISLNYHFRQRGQNPPKIHAFEADQLNFEQLQSTVATFELKEVSLHRALLGKNDLWVEKPNFHNCRSDENIEPVRAVRLDSALKDVDTGFIKMDIEGAEVDTLIGAENLILKYQPILAICCYHTSDQLLDVPLLINNQSHKYDLHCRHHSPSTLWETVCYAIPT